MRLELEKKKKEEEEKERKLAKATTVIEVLINDHQGCNVCLQVSKSLFVSCEDCPLDSEGAVCSCANDGPGVACLSCHKIKKCCDWIAWNAAKVAEASSSMTNVVPGL